MDDDGPVDPPPPLGEPQEDLAMDVEPALLDQGAPGSPNLGVAAPPAEPPSPGAGAGCQTPASNHSEDSYGQLDPDAQGSAATAMRTIWEVNEDSFQLFKAETLSARGMVIVTEILEKRLKEVNRTSYGAEKK